MGRTSGRSLATFKHSNVLAVVHVIWTEKYFHFLSWKSCKCAGKISLYASVLFWFASLTPPVNCIWKFCASYISLSVKWTLLFSSRAHLSHAQLTLAVTLQDKIHLPSNTKSITKNQDPLVSVCSSIYLEESKTTKTP